MLMLMLVSPVFGIAQSGCPTHEGGDSSILLQVPTQREHNAYANRHKSNADERILQCDCDDSDTWESQIKYVGKTCKNAKGQTAFKGAPKECCQACAETSCCDKWNWSSAYDPALPGNCKLWSRKEDGTFDVTDFSNVVTWQQWQAGESPPKLDACDCDDSDTWESQIKYVGKTCKNAKGQAGFKGTPKECCQACAETSCCDKWNWSSAYDAELPGNCKLWSKNEDGNFDVTDFSNVNTWQQWQAGDSPSKVDDDDDDSSGSDAVWTGSESIDDLPPIVPPDIGNWPSDGETTTAAPDEDIPHDGNAYCQEGDTVNGLTNDGPAEALQRCFYTAAAATQAPGQQILVYPWDSLKEKYASAKCGDTLLLHPEGLWYGKFTFDKNCSPDMWIWIRSMADDSMLPPEGMRITPCFAGVMPGVVAAKAYAASVRNATYAWVDRPAYPCLSASRVMPRIVLKTVDGRLHIKGSYLRLVGIEIFADPAGPNAELTELATSHHTIFDRVWVHGWSDFEYGIGISAAWSNYTALIDSYVTDMHCKSSTCGESQGYHAGAGKAGKRAEFGPDGPHKIVNNYIESAGEQVLFGGGYAKFESSDIEIRRNYMFRPLSWMRGHEGWYQPDNCGSVNGCGSFNGWVVKNTIECKSCDRILVEANVLENVWGGYTQLGTVFTLTPKNQTRSATGEGVCPECYVANFVARYNWIRNAGVLAQIANSGNTERRDWGKSGGQYSLHDMVVENMFWKDCWKCGKYELEIVTGREWASFQLHDVSIDHLTILSDPDNELWGNTTGGFAVVGSALPSWNVNIRNSIFEAGRYGVHLARGFEGDCGRGYAGYGDRLDQCGVKSFVGNVIIAGEGKPADIEYWSIEGRPETIADNTIAASASVLGLSDDAFAPPSLQGEPLQGLDGKPPGANSAKVRAAIAGVRLFD